ncbi:MAG: bifunctional UDP-sugar hydrolase/5'-nucleotidase [Halobacteriaceae archaeon]
MAVRILHYSDVENAFDTPEKVGRLAGLLQDLKSTDGEAIIANTGDLFAPGILSFVTEGEHALKFLRAVPPDVSTFGNHDFDYGLERTRDLVSRAPGTWVSTNIHHDGQRFGADEGVVPVTSLQSGATKIGFIGLLDDTTPSINPEAADLTVTDPLSATQEAEATLRERGADVVIVLSHLGQGDEEIAVETTVDAILGGHVHSERVERVNDTLLTRPGVNADIVFEIVIEDGQIELHRHVVEEAQVDERVVADLQAELEAAGLDEVVGHVDEPIQRTEQTVFRGETRVGNFVADAYRWAAGARARS